MELAIIATYAGCLLAIGAYYASRTESFEDFALAGRQVAWPMLLATSAASMIGGGASMGSVDQAFTAGAGIGLAACGWYLSLTLCGFFVAPRLIGKGFVTVADFYQHHYGEFGRRLISIVGFVFCMGIIAAQIVAMGKILETVFDIPFAAAAGVGAAVVIVYSALGGMWAVIQTDVLQFVLLVIGFSVAACVGLYHVGGYDALLAQVPDDFASISGTWETSKLVSVFAAFFLGEMFAPFYVQRMYTAKDARTARLGVGGAGIFMLVFLPITMVTLGFLAYVLVPDAPSGQALSEVVRVLLPTPVAAVVVAAMMACMMSSCDSILNTCSTMAVRDFLPRSASERRTVRLARLTTLVLGLCALGIALIAPRVIDLLLYSYSLWAPMGIIPFIVGVSGRYSPACTYPIICSMVCGGAVSIGWLIAGQPYGVDAAVVGFAAAALSYLLSWPVLASMRRVKGFIPLATVESAP